MLYSENCSSADHMVC